VANLALLLREPKLACPGRVYAAIFAPDSIPSGGGLTRRAVGSAGGERTT